MQKKYILAALSINISVIASILLILGIINIKLFSFSKTALLIFFNIVLIITTIYTYFSKKKNIYNTGVFISLMLNIIIIYSIISLNDQYNYLNNFITTQYKYTSYSIYVQKKTPIYNNITKLNGKKIGMLQNNKENITEYLNSKIDIEYKSYNSLNSLIEALENGEIQSIIISETEYNDTNSEETKFKNKIRPISSIKIKETIT